MYSSAFPFAVQLFTKGQKETIPGSTYSLQAPYQKVLSYRLIFPDQVKKSFNKQTKQSRPTLYVFYEA